MDALLTAFIGAGLAEWGDRTQMLVLLLAVRYGRPGPVLAGVAVAALANALISATAGVLVHGFITLRAMSLMVALALLFAGIGGLIPRKQPDMGVGWKTGPFVTTAICFFLLEFGDKTQFLTFAIAGRFDSLVLAALGATAGVVAASVPAALLGLKFEADLPVRGIRIGVAALFLLAGFIVAINALRLV
jgi:Ca2+/H+ antiporter, TMEM165/GDT1 family